MSGVLPAPPPPSPVLKRNNNAKYINKLILCVCVFVARFRDGFNFLSPRLDFQLFVRPLFLRAHRTMKNQIPQTAANGA